MTTHWQISRSGLFWMLVAQVAIVVGLLDILPIWIILVFIGAAFWRLQVFRGAWNFPGRLVKVLLVVLCWSGLLLSYRKLTGLEPLSAMLIIAFMLKVLEMHRRRDGVVLVFVGYFCSALILLFEQDIGTASYSLLCLLLVTASMVGMHQKTSNMAIWHPFKKGAVMMVQSIPLMLILFLVMPRMGAFWSVPSLQSSGKTGVSGEMTPGDLTRLGKDGSLAFRVEFEGEVPDAATLYWRGPILTRFDGRTWRMGEPWVYEDGPHVKWQGDKQPEWQQKVSRFGDPLKYSVVLEPTNQPWLYGLNVAESPTKGVGITRELRLVNREPVSSKKRYQVNSWPQHRSFPGGLHRWERRQNLQLPEGFNPKSRQRALDWYQQAGSELDYISRLLAWYNREFTYTLEPAALGRHSVDEFLNSTQQGFCSHFAGSFVFMMRAAGIPARVVTGYQGAERHPTENYLLVYQYNAHAWVEVWLEGEGWVHIDPTAAVAPERIESGFEEFFGEESVFLTETPFSLARFRDIGLINQLRLKLDSINYYWATWVLGYEQHQDSLLEKLLGSTSPARIGLFLLACGAVIMSVLAFVMLRGSLGRKKRLPVDRAFDQLCAKLDRVGYGRSEGEGARDYAVRLINSDLQNASEAKRILDIYEQLQYAGSTAMLDELKSAVRRYKPKR